MVLNPTYKLVYLGFMVNTGRMKIQLTPAAQYRYFYLLRPTRKGTRIDTLKTGYPVFRSGFSSNSDSHIFWPRKELVEDSVWLLDALQLQPKQLLDGLVAVMDAAPHSVAAIFPSTWPPSMAQSFVYQEDTN